MIFNSNVSNWQNIIDTLKIWEIGSRQKCNRKGDKSTQLIAAMATEEELKATLLKFDQGHLVKALEKTQSATDHEKLLQDLLSIDFEEMCGNFQKSGAAPVPPPSIANGHTKEHKSIDDRMEPIEDDLCGSVNKATANELESYLQVSLKEISQSHVGVLLLAGGQGTRLGVPYPKGMYDIALPSKKTLYQIQVR